jgi:hypothetical protein
VQFWVKQPEYTALEAGKMYYTGGGRWWQKQSTCGKPTGEILLCAGRGLGVVYWMGLRLDCKVIWRERACRIYGIDTGIV